MSKLPPKPNKSDGTSGVAVIYARYSSHNQRDCSIEQQIDACTAYAKSIGISISNTYEDRAITGKTDDRPSFQQMLKDSEKGLFQYVIAWKSNRMGRDMLNAMVNEERLKEAGVRCLYVEEDFEDNASGRFALRTMMNVNQFYSENMAEDIKRGLRDNALNGKVAGYLPLGYTKDKDLNILIDEDEATVVREIFTRASEGEPYADIARSLNERGIKTKRGKRWTKGSFQNLITNERYKGIYIYMDIRKEGGMPRIISDDLFDRAQYARIYRTNYGRTRDSYCEYVLTGKLYCGKCGAKMVGAAGTSKSGKLHHYYMCSAKRREHTCDKENVRRDEIEELLANAIKEHCLTDEAIEWMADKTLEYFNRKEEEAKLNLLKNQLAQIISSISNIMKAIEMGVFTPTTKSRLEELEAEKNSTERDIRIAESQISHLSREQIVACLNLYKSGKIDDRKFREDLFDTFISRIYLYDGQAKVVFTLTGDKELSISKELIDKVGCSPMVISSPVNAMWANTYMADKYFILVLPIK